MRWLRLSPLLLLLVWCLMASGAFAQTAKQITQFPLRTPVQSTDNFLLQEGGVGQPYGYSPISGLSSIFLSLSGGTISGNLGVTGTVTFSSGLGSGTQAYCLGMTASFVVVPSSGACGTGGGGGSITTVNGTAGQITSTNPTGPTVTLSLPSTITEALTFSSKVTTAASVTGGAGFNIPPGTAPTSPTNGDLWATTAGVFAQVAGATVGPFGAGLSAIGSDTLLGNPTGSSATPTAISLGVGLSIVSSVLTPQWAGGAVSSLGSNCSITSGVFNCSSPTTITLAPGLASTVGTQNPGTQTITNGSTLSQQNWTSVVTSPTYTVSYPADTGSTLLSNYASGPVAYTLRDPSSGNRGSSSPVFADQSGSGFSLTATSGIATFYGFVGGGVTNPTFSAYSVVQCVDDGTNYFCLVSQGYSQLAINSTAVNGSTNGYLLYSQSGLLANQAPNTVVFSTGTLSLGGNLVTGAALTTTGALAETFAFPAASYTYTFPSATGALATLANISQTFLGATTFSNNISLQTINGYKANVASNAGTSCTLGTTSSGCSGATTGDCGTLVRFTSNSAIAVTVPSTFPAGCEVEIEQDGTAKVSVTQGAGAILRANPHSFTGTYGQYALIGVVGLATGIAVITGDGS